MPLIRLTLQLCPDCHHAHTEEVMISTPRKYYRYEAFKCSNCAKELHVTDEKIMVGYLNGS